jgi:hypothetical protein
MSAILSSVDFYKIVSRVVKASRQNGQLVGEYREYHNIDESEPVNCSTCNHQITDECMTDTDVDDVWCRECWEDEVRTTAKQAVLFAIENVKTTGESPPRHESESKHDYEYQCLQRCINYEQCRQLARNEMHFFAESIIARVYDAAILAISQELVRRNTLKWDIMAVPERTVFPIANDRCA